MNRTSLEEVVKTFQATETEPRTCTRVTKTQQNRTEPRNRILPRKTLRNHPTRAKTHHSSSSSEPRKELRKPRKRTISTDHLLPFLEQNPERQPTLRTQQTALQSSMAPSHSNKTKELRINPPTHLTGNRDDLDNFIQDCTLYLTLNKAVYETDE